MGGEQSAPLFRRFLARAELCALGVIEVRDLLTLQGDNACAGLAYREPRLFFEKMPGRRAEHLGFFREKGDGQGRSVFKKRKKRKKKKKGEEGKRTGEEF